MHLTINIKLKASVKHLIILVLFFPWHIVAYTVNNNTFLMLSDRALSSYWPVFSNKSYLKALNKTNRILLKSLSSVVLDTQNGTLFSYEKSDEYYSCSELLESFHNRSAYLLSHYLINCEEFISQNIKPQNNSLTPVKNLSFISNSATVYQVHSAISILMKTFNLNNYAIIKEYKVGALRHSYFSEFADQFQHLTAKNNEFIAKFVISAQDSNLENFILKYASSLKVIILLLQCGEEVSFLNNTKVISILLQYQVSLISVYISPVCLSLVNRLIYKADSVYLEKFYYKLVAVDFDLNNTQEHQDKLNKILNISVSNNDENILTSGLNELETLMIQEECFDKKDCFKSAIKLEDIGQVINYEQLANQTMTGYETTLFAFFRRKLKFIFYKFSNSNFTQIANITLPEFLNLTSNLDASLTRQIDFRIVTEESNQSSTLTVAETIIIVVVVFLIVIGILFLIYLKVRNFIIRKELSKGPNKIILQTDDLDFHMESCPVLQSRSCLRERDMNLEDSFHDDSISSFAQRRPRIAKYKGDICIIKYLKIKNFNLRNNVMRELKTLRDIRHENVNAFIGFYHDIKTAALVFEYAGRGSLYDIIRKPDIKLDWNFKWSFLNDLARGMRYIHQSPLKFHGYLKSTNCVIDSRWVLKVTDFGLLNCYEIQKSTRSFKNTELLWTAPEHLRQGFVLNKDMIIKTGSQMGDVFSFGIIMQEVIVRGAPYCMTDLTAEEIITKIKKSPPLFRPSVSKTAAPPEYVNIMRDCWSELPEIRPTFEQLQSMFKSLNGEKKVNIVELMFKMVEQYTNNLEELVQEKTIKLEEEKKITEKLLSEMLPKSVAEALKAGKKVAPETFDQVTIYFSDIVGFTTICAYSSPIEVIQLLNDLYTLFDEILSNYDGYKVETIGDAYMVVSGLPERNGNRHAGEIATFALDLLHHCGKFQMQHLPGIPLRVRIGIHSGKVVSGVVGLKMPRYCLFGDTVNTASRMESTSYAYRIHVSETTAKILEEIGGYKLEYRGITSLIGKGEHKTYWLTGKEGFDKKLPEPFISENNHGIDDKLIDAIKIAKAEHSALQEQFDKQKTENQTETLSNDGSLLQSCEQSEKSTSPFRFRRVSEEIIKEIKKLSISKSIKPVSPYRDDGFDQDIASDKTRFNSLLVKETPGNIFNNKLTNVES